MDSLDKLDLLTDAKSEAICILVRRSEGNVFNPNVGAVGKPVTIHAVESNVSMHSVNNFKLAGFYVRHQIRTCRLYVPRNETLTTI